MRRPHRLISWEFTIAAVLLWGGGDRVVDAAIDFNFIFEGDVGSGIGFEDPQQGQARRDALEDASVLFGGWFDHDAMIDILVTSIDDDDSSTLASAGSALTGVGGRGFGNIGVVRNKIVNGFDRNGGSPDGFITFNFDKSWEISADPSDVGNNEFDFYAVVFHELTHALGFFSAVTEAGTDLFGAAPPSRGRWTEYDRYLTDSDGQPVINPITLVLDQAVWDDQSTGGASPDNGLFFSGPNAVAANDGRPVGLYTPSSYSSGSSVSHVDDQNDALEDLMMSAFASRGPGAREYSEIERGIMMDLGYLFTPPEPIEGDANGDRLVDAIDLNAMALNWQQAVENGPIDGDFNSDGFVDAGDLNLLALNWQFGIETPVDLSFELAWESALTAAAVPQPATLDLLTLCLAGQWIRRRGGPAC